MAIDKRATRLGVLALVGVDPVQPDRCPAVVPADRPGRGAAAAVDARPRRAPCRCCPSGAGSSTSTAGSSPTTSASSPSASTGSCCASAPTGARSSAACRGGSACRSRTMEARLRRQDRQPVPADAVKQGRRRADVAAALLERIEDFPGVSDPHGVGARVPVRAARRPRGRLHGRDHRGAEGRLPRRRTTC